LRLPRPVWLGLRRRQSLCPHRFYGTPDDCRRFIDQAHALGMGVILDVVYNHIGPEGNVLPDFSPEYFTDRYSTDWGEAINYEDAHAGPVREYFLANAGYWIEEFHFDGLRLDATQNIYDTSADHILAAVARRVRRTAGGRATPHAAGTLKISQPIPEPGPTGHAGAAARPCRS
jgi:maltooligosyltrehalose trehalohydrolase